ncbi:hypothetical protein AMTRI_Chr02g215640 [Amborella trichopoda]
MGLSFEQDFCKYPKRMLKLEDIRLDLICKPFQIRAFGVFHYLDSYEKLVILYNLGHFRNYPKHILWLFYYCQQRLLEMHKNAIHWVKNLLGSISLILNFRIRYRITRMLPAKKTRHYKHLDFTVQIHFQQRKLDIIST